MYPLPLPLLLLLAFALSFAAPFLAAAHPHHEQSSSSSSSSPSLAVIKTQDQKSSSSSSSSSLTATKLPSPSCALNGLPCPVPVGWAENATWNLTESTVIQPATPNFFIPEHPWGLVSLDWQVARNIWFEGNNTKNTTCEATSIKGCQLLKERGLAKRCFIYHNMELALEWLESQRAVMYDPSKADYFLQYTDGQGHKLGKIYNEPRAEGDQYFWDFTNPAARDYFVSSILQVLSDPTVDGTFTDDVQGVPNEHPNVQANIKLTNAELADLQYNTQLASQSVIDALAVQGKGNWQALSGLGGATTKFNRGNCVSFMHTRCQPFYQGRMLLMQADTSPANKNQTVAAFLISRPPVAYLGWGYASGDEKWDNIFLLQVGEPVGLCVEVSAGVYERTYTQGTARIDCNTWAADLPFPSL